MAGLVSLSQLYGLGGPFDAGINLGGSPPAAAARPAAGLSLADIYTPGPQAAMPQMSQLPSSIGDLSQEDRDRLRRLQLFQVLASGLQNWGSGQVGSGLLQGVGQSMELEQQAVARAREEAQRRAAAEQQLAQQRFAASQQNAAERDRQQRAQMALNAYQQIAAVAGNDDPSLVSQAELAARSGDLKTLQGLLEAAPQRVQGMKALRARGIDPNDPLAIQGFQADQKAARDLAQTKAETEAKLQLQRKYPPPQAPFAPKEGQIVQGTNGNLYLVDQVSGGVKQISLPDGSPLVKQPTRDEGALLQRRAVELALQENRAREARGEPSLDVAARARELIQLLAPGTAAQGAVPGPVAGPSLQSSHVGSAARGQVDAVQQAVGRSLTDEERRDVETALARGYDVQRIIALLRNP